LNFFSLAVTIEALQAKLVKTDGRTDRRTDGIAVASTALCNASIAARCKSYNLN